jgi:arylsulfatase A-like enzyme
MIQQFTINLTKKAQWISFSLDAARPTIGTLYKWGGTQLEEGIDCFTKDELERGIEAVDAEDGSVDGQFNGQSPRWLCGDVVEEIDFQTGRIIEAIKELGIAENTYIVFTSDNGPWYLDRHPKLSLQKDSGGSHGGDAAPLRGHKTSAWEGGVRVPCVMWAPGRIPAGTVCSEMATTMDILPTFAVLPDGVVPRDRVIDGHGIVDLIHGELTTKSPTDRFYYYVHTQLMAVRFGNWKLHLPRKIDTMKRWDVFQKKSDLIKVSSPMLFDLKKDIGEQVNLADQYPEKVEELTRIADKARQDIGDYDWVGENGRFYDPGPRRSDILQWTK